MSPKSHLVVALVALPALACAAEAGPQLALTIAPLTLPGIADACYSIDVHNVAKALVDDDALVWSQANICASRYGNASGSVTYIGTCDASPDGRINTVSLTLEGLCITPGCDVADVDDPGRVATDAYVNPCPDTRPCQLERACRENADTLVQFDLTIMRDAAQGFFDVAVNFEDIFCSAKLDCQPELLHRPEGERDLTAVLAFACTSGADTCLYVDRPTLTCSTGTWTLDPTQGPGRIDEDSPVLYAAAVYAGDEAYTAFEKQYWNVALGLDEAALASAGDCTLSWSATASEAYWEDHTTPDESIYPVIRWNRQIVDDGVIDCAAHPLNVVLPGEDVASVTTAYTNFDAPYTFAYSNCAPDDPEPSACNCGEGYAPNVNETVCVRELTAAPTVEGTTHDVCPGFTAENVGYSDYGARFTTSTNPADFEFVSFGNPGCTNPLVCQQVAAAPWTQRLRDIGVWACPEVTSLFGTATPLDEWIGFTDCLTVATAGDYLVGIAGDNEVLLRVDGNTIYQSVSSESFASWNVMRLSLSAGTHVIELFGRNHGSVASFGAEISGPFATSELTTPQAMAAAANADYLDRIIFSTADLRAGGAQFQVSTGPTANSGLSCPAGYSLQICGQQDAVCVDRDEATCNPR